MIRVRQFVSGTWMLQMIMPDWISTYEVTTLVNLQSLYSQAVQDIQHNQKPGGLS